MSSSSATVDSIGMKLLLSFSGLKIAIKSRESFVATNKIVIFQKPLKNLVVIVPLFHGPITILKPPNESIPSYLYYLL
jgi:hypothetical protein